MVPEKHSEEDNCCHPLGTKEESPRDATNVTDHAPQEVVEVGEALVPIIVMMMALLGGVGGGGAVVRVEMYPATVSLGHEKSCAHD